MSQPNELTPEQEADSRDIARAVELINEALSSTGTLIEPYLSALSSGITPRVRVVKQAKQSPESAPVTPTKKNVKGRKA